MFSSLGIVASSHPRAAGGGGLPITDSFNRADVVDGIGSTDTGQAWVKLTAGKLWGIASNTAKGDFPQTHLVVDAGVSDCSIQVTITVTADIGLCFRAVDNDNLFVISANSGAVYKRTAGSFALAMGSLGSWASGDTMRVDLAGTSIDVFRNGVSLGSMTDSSYLTATQHGLRSHNSLGRFDDFSVTA